MVMVMVMGMVMVVVVVVVVVTMIPVVSAVSIIMAVTGHVFAVVPVVPNKVHGTATGVIFGAVACPVPLIPGRYMQVDRLTIECRIPVNHHRSGIDQRRGLRHLTDIDLTEETGFANVDG
jgi:hypothetical protein